MRASRKSRLFLAGIAVGIIVAACVETTLADREITMVESIDIGTVPSGFPVGFCLLTSGDRQYVAYYDAKKNMTVAFRKRDSKQWQYTVLPSKVEWDSHNYVTMTIDDEGYIHLSGNMHCVPLVYFRTTAPWDIRTFQRIPAMTGEDERKCTYPQFMRDADGRLIFHYRVGSSGNGNEIYNVYNIATKTWKRFLDKPLTDGGGKMNAYMSGPHSGPDGLFHLCWVWRDTPDCRSNHSPSYARSRNLKTWEAVDGKPLPLPILSSDTAALIDPVPAGGGIINGCLSIGFDSTNCPLASYHKFDKNGNTQAYVARFQGGRWIPHQVTAWEYRWDFHGGGSIGTEINLGRIRTHGVGRLALPFDHTKYGSGLLILDEKTLALIGTEKQPPRYPAELVKPESRFPGMRVKWAADSGKDQDPAIRYVLRWETLPANRDKPRQGPLPEPSMLRLYGLHAGK